MLGGAVAWLIRFLLAYAISEWRCTPPVDTASFLGMTGTAWLLAGVSVVLFAAALAAAGVSYRIMRRVRASRPDVQDGNVEWFMAQAGAVLSLLFALIIAVETIPIFFLGTYC